MSNCKLFEKSINTKFGLAKINPNGYYIIRSRKEGNNGKLLHRLIWEDFYNRKIPKGCDIYHINNNSVDNSIQNLQCVPHNIHVKYHKNHLLEDTRRKMSVNNGRYWYNKKLSDTHKLNISKSNNSTGFFRVYKQNKKSAKQGFTYCYQYTVDKKQKSIVSVDIDKLKDKVLARGLEWREL